MCAFSCPQKKTKAKSPLAVNHLQVIKRPLLGMIYCPSNIIKEETFPLAFTLPWLILLAVSFLKRSTAALRNIHMNLLLRKLQDEQMRFYLYETVHEIVSFLASI